MRWVAATTQKEKKAIDLRPLVTVPADFYNGRIRPLFTCMCAHAAHCHHPLFPLITRNHLALYFMFLYLEYLKLNDSILKACVHFRRSCCSSASHRTEFILLSMQSNNKAVEFSELNENKITKGEWGHEIKAAYTTWLLPAAVESAQGNIYFPKVLWINNVLSVSLYEMERKTQRQWVGRQIGHPVKKA